MLLASQAPQALNILAWAATALAIAAAVVGLLTTYLVVWSAKHGSRMAAQKSLSEMLRLMVRHRTTGTPRGTEERQRRATGQGARIVQADHERLIITYSVSDDTVYVLTPPGEDPRAVLRAARLVLPDDTYGELAGYLGNPVGRPLGTTESDRLVVARSGRGGTVYEPQPLSEDPAQILEGARRKLPDGTFREMAEQFGEPTSRPEE